MSVSTTMKLQDLFIQSLIIYHPTGISKKKHVLEKIGLMVNAWNPKLKYQDILERIQYREKLGDTAIGNSIAIPHTRIPKLKSPVCVVIVLTDPINFSANENKMVDLIFALLIPEGGEEQHLETLALLSEALKDNHL